VVPTRSRRWWCSTSSSCTPAARESAAEIESVLLGHPKVGDAAVFGIPHEDWGEEVKAVIEPAPGVDPGPELADEILAFCGDKLARFKTPRSVDFIVEMPRDPNGKLYKRKLRDPYWEGRERAI